MGVPDPSVVSSDVGTDLSRRTDQTSISIPNDGRAVTIQTDRRRRRRENTESQSVLSHGTNTSLLIEYFETGKPSGGSSSGRQPSVRVKVTPSAAKRHRVNQSMDGSTLEISEVGSGNRKDDRRPTHTHRIQLAPHTGEDRLTLGQNGRARSYSGDQSTLSSFVSGEDDSNQGRPHTNVTFIREGGSQSSFVSSPKEIHGPDYERRRRRRTASRNGTGDSHPEDKVPKGRRSRSVSRESEIFAEAGLKTAKLTRRRSRSLSREPISISQRDREKVEQAVKDQLLGVDNSRARKERSKSRVKNYDNDSLKPPRPRSRSASRERIDEIAAEKARARRKAAKIEGDDQNTTSPALIELIQDTIKKMLLPEIEEIKAQQKAARPTLDEALGRSFSIKGPGRANSMPDVSPKVILSPDSERGPGLGMVISGDDKAVEVGSLTAIREKTPTNAPFQSDLASTQAPGLGLGHQTPEADGEGVSLVGMVPAAAEGEHILMPDAPYRADTPGTRASILTAKSGLPYPTNPIMPSSGNTPPPREKAAAPGLDDWNVPGSEADMHGDYAVSDYVVNDRSLNPETEADHGDDDTSSVIRTDPTGYPDLSIPSMSVPPSTVLAKERKDKGRKRSKKAIDDLSEIHENSHHDNAVNLFFAEQREREQERALMNPASPQDTSLQVHHVSTVTDGDSVSRHLDKGQQVYDLGANPSMRSTPVLAHSAVASVFEQSNLGEGSNVSYRPDSRPQMSSSAVPLSGDPPMPEFVPEDDDDINTNPSIIQGPIGHHQARSWENGLGLDRNRGLNVDLDEELLRSPISPRPNSRLSPGPLGKDEGYMSAANPVGSPGTASPAHGMRGDAGMGAIDDMLDAEFQRSHRRNGMGSGNSHGMPSPLYDSATGRGIDRIESKDIVALMEHLTVRDAQRNARDTEILVTLVRSAAEMRNSFEDMKKALADQQRTIVSEVDQNTERSVQKIIQGPRPLPPTTPRRSRYPEDADEDVRKKRASVFKRALKGLSMGSSKDLERIEDMLCRLLDEVEGLKDGQQFYQQSMMQSQSLNTIENVRNAPNPEAVDPAASFANNSAGNSGYHSGGPSRQPSGKIHDQRQQTSISTIQEDATLDSPQREARGESLPLDTPPSKPTLATSASVGNTPTKSAEKHAKRESGSSSIFPKISRWSETTASTGFRNFLSKNKNNHDGSEASRSQPDFNFWETDGARGTHGDYHETTPLGSESQRTERPLSPLVPPSSRDTDAPINQANRISLDIQHPRPRVTYNHQLEQQAQQLTAEGGFMLSPVNNTSASSLGVSQYPPFGLGGFQNGKLLSPLAQDAYAQHQAQFSPNNVPVRPPQTHDEVGGDDDSSTARRPKKHRERDENGERIRKPKKERTEEEKQRRRERKERKERERELGIATPSSKKKSSRDLHAENVSEGPGRNLSKLNGPRPLSSASYKESRRHRHQSSAATNGGYSYPTPPSPVGSWQSGDDN